MSEATKLDDESRSEKLLRYALWGTIGWLVLALLHALFSFKHAATGSSQNNPLFEIDKIGAYAQGIFAPLALLWLAVAVRLQSEELALTRDEMRRSTEQQRAQAIVMTEEQERTRLAVREAGFEYSVVFWCSRFIELGNNIDSPNAKYLADSSGKNFPDYTSC